METDEQMQMAVKHHWQDACYQSVYAFEEWKDGRPAKESAIIDQIFFDFDDAANPQNAIDDAAKIACDYTTQWFSGKKGIGMLLHLNPVDIHPSMKAAVLKRTCNGSPSDEHPAPRHEAVCDTAIWLRSTRSYNR
jgi:hypothetical protein